MFWVTMILLLLLGFLAASSRFTHNNAGLKGAIDALEPASPWLGLGGLGWGLYQLIYMLLHLGVFRVDPLFAIVYTLSTLLLVGLGFFLGYAAIARVVSGGPLQGWRDGLAPKRVSMGLTAMSTAILNIIIDAVG
ncbi:MAG: hypothetical protein EP329_03760 [Deltaproteobacteria bacterium]|nr:MAG: hypothetical protein EP329_03760 [Deltaproteobacteria bacterium]